MEFKRPPSDDFTDITWNHELGEDDAELMHVLMQLKRHADEGMYFFFDGMHDADGNPHPDLLIDHDIDDVMTEKLSEASKLPWDVTGERIWEWDGAVHSLQHFLIGMCEFDAEVWTVEHLEERMKQVHRGHGETKRTMQEMAERSGFEEDALGFLIACMGDMVANDLDDYITDSFAMSCVLHKNASNLDEAMYWTQERTREAMKVIKGVFLKDDVVIT